MDIPGFYNRSSVLSSDSNGEFGIDGTANEVTVSAGTNAVTLALASAITDITGKLSFGSYTGDANGEQQITVGFAPKGLIIFESGGDHILLQTRTNNISNYPDGGGNWVTAFDNDFTWASTTFEVGQSSVVNWNNNGSTYNYFCWG